MYICIHDVLSLCVLFFRRGFSLILLTTHTIGHTKLGLCRVFQQFKFFTNWGLDLRGEVASARKKNYQKKIHCANWLSSRQQQKSSVPWGCGRYMKISIYRYLELKYTIYFTPDIYRYIFDAGPLKIKNTKKYWPYFFFYITLRLAGLWFYNFILLHLYFCDFKALCMLACHAASRVKNV